MSFYYSAPSFYSFHYVPRTNRLNHDQKKSLDNYSRYMAEKMIEIQDQYYYESQLAEYRVYSSDSEVSTSCSSPITSSPPPMLVPNPFYNPELAKQILAERQKKQMASKPTQPISPTGVKLVPNPFYNPELAKQIMSKKSTSKKL
ncbi:Protein CBG02770 [Caenorhabditis briggsae]|uniref:Uncharacterized protein n=2 Tax=Caenorhabditis briggsae TaxID=6238 RepID=A0AAE9DL15_CAEBR|nr:Protein CBG02770 [Caenorhabditis briggsae]ULU06358.1 hypothetical protein L3Y34_018309 [Caenorhabditis briggsae]UMM18309.1 hypothetical protein L5515_014434 [Caenorhabditis briggsae]CAP23808.1 Protein CBG02770 [Caenorhabditis briggsae]